MKGFLSLAIISILTLFSISAHAQVYISAFAGKVNSKSELDLDSSNGLTFAGGYAFHKHFAVELSYLNLGEQNLGQNILNEFQEEIEFILPADFSVSIDQAYLETKGWNIALVGTLPLNDKASVYGKIGSFGWESDIVVEVSVSENGVRESSTDKQSVDESDISMSVGLEYLLGKKISVNGEISRFDAGDVDNTMLALGVKVRL